MSQEEFKKQYAMVLDLTKDWPAWKLNILENSARPTVDVPRPPVNNTRNSENGEKPARVEN